MEERIRIFLLNQQTTVTINQLLNIEPLLPESKLKQIRLPFEMRKFRTNYKVFNSCLHYVFSIQKNLPHSATGEFRQKCLAQISNYYIKKRMNFQLYEYGYLCSKILCVPIQRVMHIIYFMVYARLASKPYINNVIVQARQKNTRMRKRTIRSQNDYSMHTQSIDSRHMTIFGQNNQIEFDSFRKDLKGILNSQGQFRKSGKKHQNRRYFNIQEIYPDEEEFVERDNNIPDTSYFSDQPKVINTPLKVGAFDNSSIIQRLKHSQSTICMGRSLSTKKLHMRRQKFNEDFDCGKKYESIAKSLEKQKKSQWNSQSIREDHQKITGSIMRMQKHHYGYFSSMASNIKNYNTQLDFIRNQCTSQKIKKATTVKQYDWNHHDKTPQLQGKASQIQLKKEISKPQLTKTQTIAEKQIKNESNSIKLSVKKEPNSQNLPQQNEKEASNVGLITRKANNFNQEQKLMLFSKKLKSKFKLQKYKDQYKQFLKTQMFQRQRNNY